MELSSRASITLDKKITEQLTKRNKMKDQEAAKLFHGKDRLNCAQSVLKAFQKEAALPDSTIDHARHLGGGRAPEGLCGALYGAEMLAGEDEIRAGLESAFTDIAGSTKCREIRGNNRLSCSGCVALAAKLLETSGHQLKPFQQTAISTIQ